jgi:myosin heavy subunit
MRSKVNAEIIICVPLTPQEEYKTEGIVWKDIDYIDNTGCLDLFAKKPTGLIYLLDEECRCAL